MHCRLPFLRSPCRVLPLPESPGTDHWLHIDLVVLILPDETFEDVFGLENDWMVVNVWTVALFGVCMHVVDFDGTHELQIALIDVLIQRIRGSHFEETVDVVLIDDADDVVVMPGKAGRNQIDCSLTLHLVSPDC